MKRFLKNVAMAVILGLAAASVAEASGKGGSSGGSGGRSGGSSGGSMSGRSSGGASVGSNGGFSQKSGGGFNNSPSGFKTGTKSGSFNYHLTHGTKFSHGYCYKGSDHCHWSSWCWNSYWGCYNYWCPSTCCWYYWYAPQCCYYPISYITTCTPVCYSAPEYVPTAAAPVINIQNSAANAGGVAANNTPGVPPPPTSFGQGVPPAPRP